MLLPKISNANSALETLKAPGKGLLTVSTQITNPQKAFSKYFGTKPYSSNKGTAREWQPTFKNPQQPIVLGYPCDTGSGIVRGSAYGPFFLREALYKSRPKLSQNDFGDIPVIPHLLHDSMITETQLKNCAAYLYNDPSTAPAVSPLSLLEETIVEMFTKYPNAKTLVLGGDHSMSGAIMRAYHRSGKLNQMGLLQIDAHTDLLENRFGIEHCFATWSAHASKLFKKPSAFVQIGIRASRHDKSHWQSKFGITQHWSSEIKNKSPKRFAETLLKHWETLGCKGLYISNDIDGTDSKEAPSTGTPETGGLKSDWVCELLDAVSSRIQIVGADIVEVAPVLGSKSQITKTIKCAKNQVLSINW